MSPRTIVLAIAGLAVAVAVGLAANAISRDSIGLAPSPTGSSVRLAPPKPTATPAKRPARTTKRKPKRPARKQPTTTTTTPPPTATTAPAPTATSGRDDHGGGSGSRGGSGHGSGRGRGGGDD
jgi:hypothetical protein